MKISSFLKRDFSKKETLHIFDIDDTLFYSTARIKVVKDGKVLASLSNSEFNHYHLKDGESFDFSEFRSSDKFLEGIPHRKSIRILQQLQKDPNAHIIMNTARGDLDDKEKVLGKFRGYGIDVDNIHIHRAGNLPGPELPAIKKLVFIRMYLNQHNFSEVHMYDDSQTNLQHFRSLSKDYPNIKFIDHHIQH